MSTLGTALIVGACSVTAYALGAAITDAIYPIRRTRALAFWWGFFHMFHAKGVR